MRGQLRLKRICFLGTLISLLIYILACVFTEVISSTCNVLYNIENVSCGLTASFLVAYLTACIVGLYERDRIQIDIINALIWIRINLNSLYRLKVGGCIKSSAYYVNSVIDRNIEYLTSARMKSAFIELTDKDTINRIASFMDTTISDLYTLKYTFACQDVIILDEACIKNFQLMYKRAIDTTELAINTFIGKKNRKTFIEKFVIPYREHSDQSQ